MPMMAAGGVGGRRSVAQTHEEAVEIGEAEEYEIDLDAAIVRDEREKLADDIAAAFRWKQTWSNRTTEDMEEHGALFVFVLRVPPCPPCSSQKRKPGANIYSFGSRRSRSQSVWNTPSLSKRR